MRNLQMPAETAHPRRREI